MPLTSSHFSEGKRDFVSTGSLVSFSSWTFVSRQSGLPFTQNWQWLIDALEIYLLIIFIRKQRSFLGIIGSIVVCCLILSYFNASIANKCLGEGLGLVINHFASTIKIWPSQIFLIFFFISSPLLSQYLRENIVLRYFCLIKWHQLEKWIIIKWSFTNRI